MSDTFTANRFCWLEQISADRQLSSLAISVAIRLAGYINRETGDAWPSRETLARNTGSTLSGVKRALHALIKAGHVTVEISRGRGKTNVYRLAYKTTEKGAASPPITEEKGAAPHRTHLIVKRGRRRTKRGRARTIKGGEAAQKWGRRRPPILLKNSLRGRNSPMNPLRDIYLSPPN